MAQIIDFASALAQKEREREDQKIENIMNQLDSTYTIEQNGEFYDLDVFTMAVDSTTVYLLLADPTDVDGLIHFMSIPHDGETLLEDDARSMTLQELKQFQEITVSITEDERADFSLQAIGMAIAYHENAAAKEELKTKASNKKGEAQDVSK